MGRLGWRKPPRGPLELYRRTFGEHRYVTWEPHRQLWQVRQRNPISGKDERVALVFYYDALAADDLADATGVSRDEARALLVMNRHHSVRKLYRPFDYEWVRERLQERREFLRTDVEGYNRQLLDENERRWHQIRRRIAGEVAAGFGELRRWLPVLAKAREQKRQGDDRPLAEIIEEKKHQRSPVVAGADLE